MLLIVQLSSSSAEGLKAVLIGGGASSATTNLQVQSIPSSMSTSDGVAAVVSSPGTPSFLIKDDDDDSVLCVVGGDSDERRQPLLRCRGPTLSGSTDSERASLATCSLVAGAILVDGVTVGDVESGLQYSRHARTLTAIFQARIGILSDDDAGQQMEGEDDTSEEASSSTSSPAKQTLILGIVGDLDSIEDVDGLKRTVKALYDAAAAEKKESAPFDEVFELEIVPVASDEQAEQVC